jgi:hypothetical protein
MVAVQEPAVRLLDLTVMAAAISLLRRLNPRRKEPPPKLPKPVK